MSARSGQSVGLECSGHISNFDSGGFSPAPVGVMLLANTLLGGSGMLGIPHAFAVAGWGVGMCLMFCSCIFSAVGCHLLQCSARQIGEVPCSFYTVARATVPKWTWLIDGAVAVKCFGVATSYFIIAGDLLPDVAQFFGAHGNPDVLRRCAVAFAFCVGGPLACLHNLSGLRFTSFCSVAIVCWTAMLIILFYFEVMDPCESGASGDLTEGEAILSAGGEHLPCHGAAIEPVGPFTDDFVLLLKVIPVFIFGFTCHQNIFSICNEVRSATRKRVDFIICCAYAIALASFLCSASLGYSTYGDRVTGDVLTGYPQTFVVEVTRLLFSFVAIFSYPLQIHPARICALNLWKVAFPGGDRELDAREKEFRFWAVTAVLLLGSLSVALVTSSLGIMLAIVGATGSTMVSYILPGLVYWYTFNRSHWKRKLAFVQLAIGCVIMPVCLTAAFL